MFGGLFKKSKSVELASPMEGRSVSIKKVSDPTFSEEILGKGVAIQPAVGKVFAPADGKIDTMFETGHAVSMMTDSGVELLIHVGLDTVMLKGKYYTVHKKSGDTVKKGELLIEFDIDSIKAEGYDTITPIIICNSDKFSSFDMATEKDVSPEDILITLK